MNSSLNPSGVSFAAQLKIERQQRGWAQSRVAELLGIETKTVYRWERGDFLPASSQREKLSAIFGRSLQELGLLEAPASSFMLDPMIPLPPLFEIIGRGEQLIELKERLRSGGNVALSALNGLPGVGKTALAITLAHDPALAEHFTGGILWAGLGPKPNILSHLARWATLLGLPASETNKLKTVEDWSLCVHRAIGQRTMLLVIDDAWSPEAALALKIGGSTCAHLLTTRFPPLAIQIASMGATVLRELNTKDSLVLLQRLAPQAVKQEEEAARELVEAVGGLPLGLLLMGNYLRTQSYTGSSRRITMAIQRLKNAEARLSLQEPRAPIERHPSQPHNTVVSLHSIIAVTDQQLSEEVRQAFYALSVFPAKPNSFSEAAALAVANCSLETLDNLTDAGLLQSGGTDRYTLHQTIADYAHLQCVDNTANQRFVECMATLAEQYSMSYETLEIESKNILTALEMAFDYRAHSQLMRLILAFIPFLFVRSLYGLGEIHLQRAYSIALIQQDFSGLAYILLFLGKKARHLGQNKEAFRYLEEGLEYAYKGDKTEDICTLLIEISASHWRNGKYQQAEMCLQEGLERARQFGAEELICQALDELGSVTLRQGYYDQSKTYLLEGLTLARQLGSGERMCKILLNIGVVFGEQGDILQSEKYLEDGLQIARQLDHHEMVALFLNNLGDITSRLEQYAKAEQHFKEALEYAKKSEHKEGMCILLGNLSSVARKQNSFALAEYYIQKSLELAQQIGIPQIMGYILYDKGNLLLALKQPEQAAAIFREMQASIPKGSQELVALAKYGIAQSHSLQGELEQALVIGKESLQLLREIGHYIANEVEKWLLSLNKNALEK